MMNQSRRLCGLGVAQRVKSRMAVIAETQPFEVAIRFPFGQYGATAWDTSAVSGVVEWPPSPWRIIRALVAVWHNKLPEIPSATMDRIVAELSALPVFRLPQAVPNHTRHWMPLPEHKQFDKAKTSLHLAAQLAISPNSDLLVQWPSVRLSAEDRGELAALWEHLTYLGRAESVCQVTVVAEPSVPDGSWVVPHADEHGELLGESGGESGSGQYEFVPVLCPVRAVTREQLELEPWRMRKQKLVQPPGSRKVVYVNPTPVASGSPEPTRARPVVASVEAIRFRVKCNAGVRLTQGVLLAEALRNAVFKAVSPPAIEGESTKLVDRVSNPLINGKVAEHNKTALEPLPSHAGAHWLWLASDGSTARPADGELVSDLVMWVPAYDGQKLVISDDELAMILRRLSGTRYRFSPKGNPSLSVPCNQIAGWDVEEKGGDPLAALPAVLVEVVRSGSADSVVPELVAPSSLTWRSVTPFMPDRFRKRGRDDDLDAFLFAEVNRQCARRGLPAVSAMRVVECGVGGSGRWPMSHYRRYRRNQTRQQSRSAYWLELTFSAPPTGVVSLGHLSHFGFGLFQPQGSDSD